MARGWAYYHAALCAQGAKTVKPRDNPLSKLQRFRRLIRDRMGRLTS